MTLNDTIFNVSFIELVVKKNHFLTEMRRYVHETLVVWYLNRTVTKIFIKKAPMTRKKKKLKVDTILCVL